MDITLDNCCFMMLAEAEKEKTLKSREEIEKNFKENDIPLFEKVIDFQVKYGGLSYFRLGKTNRSGFIMDLYKEYPKENYALNMILTPEELQEDEDSFEVKDKDKYHFSCMDYRYAGDWGPFIDEDGRIYGFSMGCITIAADSIEEFLEYEAVYFYLVKTRENWIRYNLGAREFMMIKALENLKKIQNQHFTDKYMSWWTNEGNSIFIKIKESHEFFPRAGFRGEMFCSEEKLNNILPNRKFRSTSILKC